MMVASLKTFQFRSPRQRTPVKTFLRERFKSLLKESFFENVTGGNSLCIIDQMEALGNCELLISTLGPNDSPEMIIIIANDVIRNEGSRYRF